MCIFVVVIVTHAYIEHVYLYLHFSERTMFSSVIKSSLLEVNPNYEEARELREW